MITWWRIKTKNPYLKRRTNNNPYLNAHMVEEHKKKNTCLNSHGGGTKQKNIF
jgi:hypothetical protein